MEAGALVGSPRSAQVCARGRGALADAAGVAASSPFRAGRGPAGSTSTRCGPAALPRDRSGRKGIAGPGPRADADQLAGRRTARGGAAHTARASPRNRCRTMGARRAALRAGIASRLRPAQESKAGDPARHCRCRHQAGIPFYRGNDMVWLATTYLQSSSPGVTNARRGSRAKSMPIHVILFGCGRQSIPAVVDGRG